MSEADYDAFFQINGNRGDAAIYQGSNANIEMGGANANQLIEYVRSYDPRSA